MTQAIILVGGKGTRIQTLHPDCPKALVPVAGKAFISRQIEWLHKHDVSMVHLAAGHLAEQLAQYAASSPVEGVTITCSAEPAPLGTAGGLRWVGDKIVSDPFLVLNGDTLLPNLDIGAAISRHTESGRLATLAVTRIEEAGRFGTVEFDDDGRLLAFREKASRKEGWINGGLYIMARASLDRIPPNEHLSLETDIFPALAEEGRLGVFPCDPPLLDMGTPAGLAAMEAFLSESHTA